ncbi:MAG: hypothetical protein QOJ89_1630 [bacterium]
MDYPCFEDVIGTVSGTSDVYGHFNNAPDFFHGSGSDTANVRIDFPDGRYVISRFVEHFETSAGSSSGVNRWTATHVDQERGTVYSADGQQIGTVMIHAMFHIRVSDYNGNFQPDPGEVSSSVDHFRASCS